MRMLNNKVLLKLLEKEEEDRGGLIIVNQKKTIVLCEVIQCASSEVVKGDKVLVAADRLASVPQGKLADVKDLLMVVEE